VGFLLETDLESTEAHWARSADCSECVQARMNQRAKERQVREAEVVLVGREQEYDIVEGMQEALLLRV